MMTSYKTAHTAKTAHPINESNLDYQKDYQKSDTRSANFPCLTTVANFHGKFSCLTIVANFYSKFL